MKASAVSALAAGAAVVGLGGVALLCDPDVPAAICGAGVNGWSFDSWITAPLAVSAVLYGTGAVRLARRGARVRGRLAFVAGWLALASALVSPLHHLGERLFSAHMVEHEIVMAVAAPLLVLARPVAALLWGLPKALRIAAGRGMAAGPIRRFWALVAAPASATFLHGLAIWLWHAPPLFDGAVANVALHRVQHLSFFLSAILFWHAMLRRADSGAAAWHVFATMLHTSLLGALLTLAPRPLFPLQTAAAPLWGLTPMEDQQLAGVIMWIPSGTIYAGACLALLAEWVRMTSVRRAEEDRALPLA